LKKRGSSQELFDFSKHENSWLAYYYCGKTTATMVGNENFFRNTYIGVNQSE